MKKLKVVGIFARTKSKINFAKTTPISQKTPLQQNMYDKNGETRSQNVHAWLRGTNVIREKLTMRITGQMEIWPPKFPFSRKTPFKKVYRGKLWLTTQRWRSAGEVPGVVAPFLRSAGGSASEYSDTPSLSTRSGNKEWIIVCKRTDKDWRWASWGAKDAT